MARVVGSRRAPLVLGVLVLAHLVAISHQVDGGDGLSLLQRVLLSALSPFQSAASGTVGGVSGIWSSYVDLRDVRAENERLRERLQQLEGELRERDTLARQAERLRGVLELREILPGDAVAAEVIAREGLPWFHTLTLDQGTSAGVRLNAPVISSSGVLGRVIAVGRDAARVQLLHDRDCGVAVRVERTRATGILSGQVGRAGAGSPELVMKYVPALADVAVDDVVVTSGLDRIFPPGLVVGRVREIKPRPGLFQDVTVMPAARFDEVEEALVLRQEPRDDTITEVVE